MNSKCQVLFPATTSSPRLSVWNPLLAFIGSTDACEYLSTPVSTWQSSAPSGVVGQLCLGGILIS